MQFMQLSNLCALPLEKYKQVRYAFNKLRGKSIRLIDPDEKEDVLQHEDKDN